MEEQPKKAKCGRKPKDWDGLFAEWLKSGLPRKEFLRLKGMDPNGGTVRKHTVKWEDQFKQAKDTLNQQYYDLVKNKTVAAVVDNVVHASPRSMAKTMGSVYQGETGWQAITKWRAHQSAKDWTTAEEIRVHVGLLLKNALVPNRDANGNVIEGLNTMLKAHELRSLAVAASEVQRIQRLALGLSTDNIGIDSPDSLIDTKPTDGTKQPANLFVVELTKAGKFRTARPRRAS